MLKAPVDVFPVMTPHEDMLGAKPLQLFQRGIGEGLGRRRGRRPGPFDRGAIAGQMPIVVSAPHDVKQRKSHLANRGQ